MNNQNEKQLLTYLQSLVITTQSMIDSKKQSIELYEDVKTSPRPSEDVIESVRESINPLMFRLEWLQLQIENINFSEKFETIRK